MLILSLGTTLITILIGVILIAILDRSHPTTMGTITIILAPKNSTSQLESMLKDFITSQKAFNKSVEEKLEKLDSVFLKVDNIAHDVEMLKIRTSLGKEHHTHECYPSPN